MAITATKTTDAAVPSNQSVGALPVATSSASTLPITVTIVGGRAWLVPKSPALSEAEGSCHQVGVDDLALGVGMDSVGPQRSGRGRSLVPIKHHDAGLVLNRSQR